MSGDFFRLPADRVLWGMDIARRAPRYYLQGVRVEPLAGGGALLVATEGRVMLVQHAPEAIAPRAATLVFSTTWGSPSGKDWEDECDIDPDLLHVLVPSISAGQTVAAPCCWRGDKSGDDIRAHMIVSEIKGEYVDWRQALDVKAVPPIIPGKTGDQAYLSLTLLAGFAQFWRGARLHYLSGPEGMAHITFERDPNAFAVLMPNVPAWHENPLPGLLRLCGRGDIAEKVPVSGAGSAT